jgi:hypothetical protein
MKKCINKFLGKCDFSEDLELKTLNEEYHYFSGAERKLFVKVYKRNIEYFIKCKKLYLAKLLLVIISVVIASVIFIGSILLTLDYMGIINVHISRPTPKKEIQFTVYIPDTDTLAQIECQKRKIKYIIMFLPDPNKNWILFKKRFQNIESHGLSNERSYYALNGEYWGRYQLGTLARKVSNINENTTWQEFSSNPDLQEGAFLSWIRYIKILMQKDIDRYGGNHGTYFMNGIQITESGIIALAHNAGCTAAHNFLINNGTTMSPQSIPMKFLKIGGYNLNIN